MKKIFLLLISGLFISSSFAIVIVPKDKKIYADQVFIPVGKTGKKISLAELSTIKLKNLQELTGNPLNFTEKLMIKAGQNKLRSSINPDGSLNIKRFNKYLTKSRSGETGFHVGGFVLGLLLGLIGVIIAYLINDDYKRNRVKWAWIGWGIWVAIVLIAVLSGV